MRTKTNDTIKLAGTLSLTGEFSSRKKLDDYIKNEHISGLIFIQSTQYGTWKLYEDSI